MRFRCPAVPTSLALLILLTALTSSHADPRTDVSVGPEQVRVRVEFSAPEMVSLGAQQEPSVGNLPRRAIAPGHPRLPVASRTVLLPEDARVSRVTVRGTPVELAGRYDLSWGQPPRRVGASGGPRVERDPAVYGSDAWYPAQPVRIAGEGTLHGFRVATIQIWPAQVRPASGAVRSWRALEIHIELSPIPPGERDGAVPPHGTEQALRDLVATTVNPETALGYGPLAPGRDSAADQPYLIVTTESLRPAFELLIEHRAARGLPGEIVTMEWVEARYDGRDRAEKLRRAIREAYQERGTSFVLLGGDDVNDDGEALIPIRHCKPSDNTPSDYYFGALDGDWDTDGDGTFCEADEVDYYTEVHVGRATVDTLEEAEHWRDKLLSFEAGLPEARREDLVFMGEKLDDSTYGDDAMEETAELIDEDEYELERLYARPETFSKPNVIASLNRGPHLTNHLGHAGSNYVMGLGIADVEGLLNEIPFFSYSQGCYAGAFDQGVSGNGEAISEHFLTADHAGHGVVMNGRYGWYCVGSPHCLSQRLAHEFYDAIFTEGLDTLGEANDDSRADYAPDAQSNGTARYCFLETNLHGDPAAPVHLRRGRLRYASHRLIEDDPAYGNANGVADPGETVRLVITIENAGSEPATGVEARLRSSAESVTVHDDWGRWPDIPPGESRELISEPFSAGLAGTCGAAAPFRLEVHHDGVVDVSVFSVLIGERSEWTLLEDDFEDDQGWETGGDAREGDFVRDDPHGVVDGFAGRVQPEDDATQGDGTRCWVTANPEPASGFDAHDGEIDRGTTWITSPEFTGLGDGELRLRFSRWFHRTGVQALDQGYYRAFASNDGGANWTELERLDATVPSWRKRDVDLDDHLEPSSSMKLRFEAHESIRMPGDPIVELLIDDVQVYRREDVCTHFESPDTLPPNSVGPTLEVSLDGGDVLLTWIAPGADTQHDPARSFPVRRSRQPTSGFETVAEPCRPLWRDMGRGDAAWGSRFYLVGARNAAGDSGELP
jgi:hypothetical protein